MNAILPESTAACTCGRLPGEREIHAIDCPDFPAALAESRRTAGIDWSYVESSLNVRGWCELRGLLNPTACDLLASGYEWPSNKFRSQVIMQNCGFGRGRYVYYAYPLPNVVQLLRESLYPNLVPIANAWHEKLRNPVRFPAKHSEFLERCHEAGQTRPTPLLLEYGQGDFNCLHQDLYGEHVFPLQVAVLLSEPGTFAGEADFTGGEFCLTTTVPRQQSRVEVVPLRKGDAVVFAVNSRPVVGAKNQIYTVNMRHGVSPLRSGSRHTLGIIFHDAK
jgi:hypothetical protein